MGLVTVISIIISGSETCRQANNSSDDMSSSDSIIFIASSSAVASLASSCQSHHPANHHNRISPRFAKQMQIHLIPTVNFNASSGIRVTNPNAGMLGTWTRRLSWSQASREGGDVMLVTFPVPVARKNAIIPCSVSFSL